MLFIPLTIQTEFSHPSFQCQCGDANISLLQPTKQIDCVFLVFSFSCFLVSFLFMHEKDVLWGFRPSISTHPPNTHLQKRPFVFQPSIPMYILFQTAQYYPMGLSHITFVGHCNAGTATAAGPNEVYYKLQIIFMARNVITA